MLMSQPIHTAKKRTVSVISVALLISLFATFASVAPASAAACTWTHVVRPGDSLGLLAHNYGTTVADILAANPQITNSNLIFRGTTICISATTPAPTPLPNSYTVNAGDTLSLIAFRFGATIADLAKINGLGNVNLIFAGEKLSVPKTP